MSVTNNSIGIFSNNFTVSGNWDFTGTFTVASTHNIGISTSGSVSIGGLGTTTISALSLLTLDATAAGPVNLAGTANGLNVGSSSCAIIESASTYSLTTTGTLTLTCGGVLTLNATTGIYASPTGYFYCAPGTYVEFQPAQYITMAAQTGVDITNSTSGLITISNTVNAVDIFGDGAVTIDTQGSGGRLNLGASSATSLYLGNPSCAVTLYGGTTYLTSPSSQSPLSATVTNTQPAGWSTVIWNQSSGEFGVYVQT